MDRDVDIVVRAITEAELPAWVRTDAAGFGEQADEMAKHMQRWRADELDRTRAAFEGDALVATSRNFSFELTLPGATTIPAGGVSAVAVLPTHRRRGILRSMMAALLDDSVARGESVSMLTASEGGIYRRFGFGVSTFGQALAFDVRDIEFARPRPAGRFRYVDPDELGKVAPGVFDRVRATYPGAVSRSEIWWAELLWEPDFGHRFDVLYEAPDGSIDGCVTYGVKDRWLPEPEHEVRVRDLVAATPEAEHALWRYVCEIDLVRRVVAPTVPMDSPLPWLLASARPVKGRKEDFVWTRLLDVCAALGARRYAVPGRLVLDVHDAMRPGDAADGRFVLDGDAGGASVQRTDAAADLELDVADLSAIWLGGVRASTLAGAGLVMEHRAGALAEADAMFASTPAPYPFTWF